MDLMLILTWVMLSLLVSGTAGAEEKITIGAVEDVIFLPWGGETSSSH